MRYIYIHKCSCFKPVGSSSFSGAGSYMEKSIQWYISVSLSLLQCDKLQSNPYHDLIIEILWSNEPHT